MVSFHVLLLDRAGNNLVNADFSLYLGHIFAVKHIYLTLYIAYMCRIAPIYSVHLVPARCAVHCFHLLAGRAAACSWRSLSVLFAPLACPRACACVRSCSRACLLPCLSAPVPACSRCSRLYCSFSRRALARCSTLSARRKLFRDRFQAVDICSAVVRRDG